MPQSAQIYDVRWSGTGSIPVETEVFPTHEAREMVYRVHMVFDRKTASSAPAEVDLCALRYVGNIYLRGTMPVDLVLSLTGGVPSTKFGCTES